MNGNYIELLSSRNLYYRETIFNKELLEFDYLADEYRVIYKKDKFALDVTKNKKLLTNIIIAAYNINPEDNANFFNNIDKMCKYNSMDKTTIMLSDDTHYLIAYLKSINLEFRYVVTDVNRKTTINLIKLAARASSPDTDFFIVSFFNQTFVRFEQVMKLINSYETNDGSKGIFIPIINKNYSNPMLITRDMMNKLLEYSDTKGLTDFIRQNEATTAYIDLDEY